MFKIINFKEIIYRQGAFFDSLHIYIKTNSLKIDLCTVKSGQFTRNRRTGNYVKQIGIRLKLPYQCEQFELILHPKIINLETQFCSQIIQTDKQIDRAGIEIETEYGQFSCYANIQQQKFITKYQECQQQQISEFISNNWTGNLKGRRAKDQFFSITDDNIKNSRNKIKNRQNNTQDYDLQRTIKLKNTERRS